MLVLMRDVKTDRAIQGRLYLNGHMVCYTLENRSKALPCGTYAVQNSRSAKFKRELPLVWNENVPASRGFRIHVGNDAVKDSSGCILVGMGRDSVKATLSESKPAETMVTMLCRGVGKLVICEEHA